MKRSVFSLLLAGTLLLPMACGDGEGTNRGDLAKRGGSPTVRVPHGPIEDEPFTANDESNDQPLGHFGTITVEITSHDSGNTYTLDAEVFDTNLERVYFPKGGWVDFYSCEVDEDLYGDCEDEEGRWWTVEGESSWGGTDSFVDDEWDQYDDEAPEDGWEDYDEYDGDLGYGEEGGGYP